MQENQIPQTPTVDSPQATVMQTVDEKPKKNTFLTGLLSTLLIFAIVIAGFFAYQTQKLAKELSEFKNQNLTTSTPEPESTFPMYTEPSPDPTANWKTYTNIKNGYLLKYPDGYIAGQNGVNSDHPETVDFLLIYTDPDKAKFAVSVYPKSQGVNLTKKSNDHYTKLSTYKPPSDFSLYPKMDNQAIKPITQESFLNVKSFSYVIKGNFVDDGGSESLHPIKKYNYLWTESGNNIFLISYDDDSKMDQILSTFKFTN